MSPPLESVHDFVLQIEKTLAARRLYQPASAPYREANEKLLEKCRAAAAGDSLSLRLGPTDLFLDKVSVVNRPKQEESFFFPLYRDGLRELTFSAETSAADLESLLGVFEAREQQLGSAEDMVNLLWRRDLTTIAHSAVDGIGDGEDDGSGGENFGSLVSELAEKIKSPAAPKRADVNVAAPDVHYDATTIRRTLDENPAVLRLTAEQMSQLRAEVAAEGDQQMIERFVEILLIILRLPFKSIEPANVSAILGQFVEGYWSSREIDHMTALLVHMRGAGQDAPNAQARAALNDMVAKFLTQERLAAIMERFTSGAVPVALASRLWDITPDAQIWPLLLDAYSRLPEGDARVAVLAALRRRLAANVDLLAQTFSSPDAGRVRAAMALIDERTERIFAKQIISLASHPDEGIRLKGLGFVVRLGGPEALDILWKTMESDAAKSVRLYAFRAIQGAKFPGLAARLQALVTSAQFAERPVWEREKYVRLLGSVAGAAVEPLFESWIPPKRWMWQSKDLEMLELALRGLAASGDSGYAKVQKFAESGGKPAEIARKVLDSVSRHEIGDTAMRPLPDPTKS